MGLIGMGNGDINSLVEQYKSKMKYVGMQSDEIHQVKRMIHGNGPDDEKRFVVEGIWAHQKLLSTNVEIEFFLFCPECIYSQETTLLVQKFLNKMENAYVVSKRVFEKLSERDEPDGLLSIGKFPEYDIADWKPKDNSVIAILDGLETPGNIGTILRTCDGAGVDAVFICNKRARMTNPKLIKASMGAAFVIPMIEFDSVDRCRSWLLEHNFHIYLADTQADHTYKSYEYEGNTALVVGSERYGISKEWNGCGTRLLSIPMLGVCDSLNVGTAASIILYEIGMKKQRDMVR